MIENKFIRFFTIIAPVALLGIAGTSIAEIPGTSSADLGTRDCVVLERLTDMENNSEDIIAVMFEYLKMVNKDARDNAKIARSSKELELRQREAGFTTAVKKIDAQKQEAQERAGVAMSAASNELVVGIVSGALSIARSSHFHEPNGQEFLRFMASADALNRDLVKLNHEIKRSYAQAKSGQGKTFSNTELDKMKEQLTKVQQQLRDAKKSARPCLKK